MANKRLILTLQKGNFECGFCAFIEFKKNGKLHYRYPHEKDTFFILPDAPNIPRIFQTWQTDFNTLLKGRGATLKKGTHASSCAQSARQLKESINSGWLDSATKLQEILNFIKSKYLTENEEFVMVIQTEHDILRQLPWPVWKFIKEDYTHAEIVLGCSEDAWLQVPLPTTSEVRILAVFGCDPNSSSISQNEINVKCDEKILDKLAQDGKANVDRLYEPELTALQDWLLCQQGYDILVFSGHSFSQQNGKIGLLNINKNTILRIDHLEGTFLKAAQQGLQLAIFNSCQGLGLAHQLAKLKIPRSIVMRELISDDGACTFLPHFFKEFVENEKSLYVSVREARLRLERHYNSYPGISWLPVIYENLAVVKKPLYWNDFKKSKRTTKYPPFLDFIKLAYKQFLTLLFWLVKRLVKRLVKKIEDSFISRIFWGRVIGVFLAILMMVIILCPNNFEELQGVYSSDGAFSFRLRCFPFCCSSCSTDPSGKITISTPIEEEKIKLPENQTLLVSGTVNQTLLKGVANEIDIKAISESSTRFRTLYNAIVSDDLTWSVPLQGPFEKGKVVLTATLQNQAGQKLASTCQTFTFINQEE